MGKGLYGLFAFTNHNTNWLSGFTNHRTTPNGFLFLLCLQGKEGRNMAHPKVTLTPSKYIGSKNNFNGAT